MSKVLITDDNRAFAENLAEILEDAGHQAVIANSGSEALRLAAATRFDALLSDMRMPEMGGADLVHHLRRIDPGLPAIVITAYTYDNELARARHEGLLGILPKPVPMEILLELLSVARRGGLVVLVDDDASLSDNLCEILRMHGFAAVTAASVLETEHLGEVAPFAALVDLRMPGSPDGEAMRRLATRFPGLPMLVVTGYRDITPPVVPDGYFHKPFETANLLAAVERLYKARRE
ncbi:MAG TPA: response regulator [Pseudomonadota bacterium]|jgi:DNA-binding NtrC family response regulator|nr:response regulator [Pseudomonadota bacterium]